MRAPIEGTGARLRHLTPYSPDFSSIKNAFAKLQSPAPQGGFAHALGHDRGAR